MDVNGMEKFSKDFLIFHRNITLKYNSTNTNFQEIFKEFV